MTARRANSASEDPAAKAFREATKILDAHPLFSPLLYRTQILRHETNSCPEEGWAVVDSNGRIYPHPKRKATREEWVFVLAHCLLHLGFGHLRVMPRPTEWNLACDYIVTRFLLDLKLGRTLPDIALPLPELPASEEQLYARLCDEGIDDVLFTYGLASPRYLDMIMLPKQRWGTGTDWTKVMALALSAAVVSAVNVTAGRDKVLGKPNADISAAIRAKEWFISSYPLLGAMAATFEIVEDPDVCRREEISIAAVNAEASEIYLNTQAGLTVLECRFVIAHELLHVGLRHQARRQGRDPWYWNVACDYVINQWLVEMGLGELPTFGALYDPQFKALSAEAIYDRIVTDLRRYRKLATLRGQELGDMLENRRPEWWSRGDGLDLDSFYRRCLSQGLVYHEEQARGLLPAGLIEEIRALSHPPLAWDVQLAQWFDNYFAPLEKRRSYARPSRRQSSTPDIPRPQWVPRAGAADGRTFGVVLDTSGSMDRHLLAKALGAIASYSISREVPAVRVIFCDAVPFDEGYLAPEALAGRVRVKGRGGTQLQPAIDLLLRAEDFPKAGPLLVITDGQCDRLHITREHAFLLPRGAHLPFVPKGKVFFVS